MTETTRLCLKEAVCFFAIVQNDKTAHVCLSCTQNRHADRPEHDYFVKEVDFQGEQNAN